MSTELRSIKIIIDVVPGGWAPLQRTNQDDPEVQRFYRKLHGVQDDQAVKLIGLDELEAYMAGLDPASYDYESVLIISRQGKDADFVSASHRVHQLLPNPVVTGLAAGTYEASHQLV